MEKLKLSAVLDDKLVKLTVELPAGIHRDLMTYAEVLGRQWGRPSNPRNWSHRCWPVLCRQTEPSCERAEKSKRQGDPSPPNGAELKRRITAGDPGRCTHGERRCNGRGTDRLVAPLTLQIVGRLLAQVQIQSIDLRMEAGRRRLDTFAVWLGTCRKTEFVDFQFRHFESSNPGAPSNHSGLLPAIPRILQRSDISGGVAARVWSLAANLWLLAPKASESRGVSLLAEFSISEICVRERPETGLFSQRPVRTARASVFCRYGAAAVASCPTAWRPDSRADVSRRSTMTIGTKNLSRRATLAGPPAITTTEPNRSLPSSNITRRQFKQGLKRSKKAPGLPRGFGRGALARGGDGAADFATHLCKIAHFGTRWPHDHGFAPSYSRLRSLG